MSDDGDAGPHHKRKRKSRRLNDSTSASSSGGSPIGNTSRRIHNRTRNPIQDSSDSESGGSCIVNRRRKRVARVSSDSESDSSGSSIVNRTKKSARINSDSDSGSEASDKGFQSTSTTSQWETDFSDPEPETSQNATAKPVQETNVDSDSSDGQSEKCPICLISFKTQEIGTPESCDHMFCLECIQEWSKNMNTCPVDRQEYNLILVRKNIEGKVVNQIAIEKPAPQNDVGIVEDPTFCEICGSSEFEDRMLLCDGCDLGFHLYCLSPPLDDVPAGSWFCNDCSPDDVVDSEITLYEIQMLFDDVEDLPRLPPGSRRRNSVRLVPRTRQSERVRRQIANNRLNQSIPSHRELPSTSSGLEDSTQFSDRVTSTTTSRRTYKRKPKKKTRRQTYKTVYKIDEATGETVAVRMKKRRVKKHKKSRRRRDRPAVRPKTVKKRLAVQLGICAPKSVPQNLPDVRVPSNMNSIGLMRHQAGIPALHLFGQTHELDYFSDEDIDGSDVLIRRAPNHSDVYEMRRAARRKSVAIPSAVSSTNDLLGSILDTQERFHSRNTVFSVDKNGKFKMEPKSHNNNDTNYININQQSTFVRQRPTSYTNNSTSPSSNNYREESSSSGGDYRGNQHSTPTSTMEPVAASQSGGGGDPDQDMPQDYSQRTLCATYEPTMQEADQNKRSSESNTRSNTPNSESEVDIYSDIETVSTSKVDDVDNEFKPTSPLPLLQQNDSNTAEDDDNNDSESDMVIDTEKEPDKSMDHEEDAAKEETTVTSTVDSNSEAAPEKPSAYSNSVCEIQSGAVQSSNQNDYADKDQYDDDDSEDGCPNFSIYSKESINLAKDTDISLPAEEEPEENNQVGEVSSSPSGPERKIAESEPVADGPEDLDEGEIQQDEAEEDTESIHENLPPANDIENNEIEVINQKEAKKKSTSGGLYSDSEDESIVRKENQSFAIADLRNMTEDISEEERSYTPCLDEKGAHYREGIEGLDTEMISDEDRNDFDESHEHKTVSDGGDALEINAKESELDFTRPEDYEEGEIIDKLKGASKKAEVESDNKKKEEETPKKPKKKDKTSGPKDKDGNKENEGQSKEASFKKLSKSNKDRNYRDKDRSKSREKKSEKSEKEKEREKRDRKKEKRKEIERYDVRALIAEKPRRQKDQFGRDIRSQTRSRTRSLTPPVRRSVSRTRRSPTPKRARGRSRTRNRSRSRTPPRRRSRSKNKKRKRSGSRPRKLRKSTERAKVKKKARSHSRHRSKTPRRKREWNRRRSTDWTPSFSRSASAEPARLSPGWTPPRIIDKAQPSKQQHSLKVILPNDANKKKKDKKRKGDKRKEGTERQRKRNRHDRTPPPSKEVFASGDNILVSVSFNKENETRDVTTRDKRRKDAEEPPKKKRKRNKNKKDLSGVKPVAIIDLERSPFQEIIPSPKDIIVLSDSDNNEADDLRGIQKSLCDSSQQVASPERIVNSYSTGPKTPPEPQIKFSLNAKQPTIRAISNPLHEADDMENEPDQEGIISDSVHKGPNTPPEPPNSPPSSPDAYDPFEPTKSRSPTPEPAQSKDDGYENNVSEGRAGEDKTKPKTPDALKSLTPPVADIQPADSQSSMHATPEIKSPERIGVVINQVLQPLASGGTKPVAQTIPFSSVPTSLISTQPITNLAPPRINIINSTIVQPSHVASSIPQRIVLPNILKIPPTKSTVKSTPIKPMPSKNNLNKRKTRQNGTDDIILDLDSPYSPGSSDYEDLFEPPPDTMGGKTKKNSKQSSKTKNTFDALFGSPSYNAKKKNEKVKKVQVSPTKGTKQVGVKLDEDNLKILDELPNSAVEMQVKDKYLKKLNRQERVVEEVKLVLKPHYNKKRINKEEYKDILRRSVPKICHNKTGEINPTKIKNLIEAYVKKIRHSKKVTSSSSVNPQKV